MNREEKMVALNDLNAHTHAAVICEWKQVQKKSPPLEGSRVSVQGEAFNKGST